MPNENKIFSPEEFQKIFAEDQKSKSNLKSRYAKLRKRLKANNFLTKTLLSPAILTIIITAIAGPFILAKVNNNLKTEQIQYETAQRNRELQTKIIDKVLEYAFSTDYSKPEAIDRIGIVAQMIDENNDVFGLSFSKTIAGFDNILTELDSGVIMQNNKDINVLKKRIYSLNSKIKKINIQKTEVEELYNKGKISITEKNKQLEILNVANENAVYEIKTNKGQIAFLQNQIIEVKNNLQRTLERLTFVTQKNKEYNITIGKLKEQEKLSNAQVASLFIDFQEASDNINILEFEIQNFRNSISKLQKENLLMAHTNDSLKKIVENVREYKQNN